MYALDLQTMLSAGLFALTAMLLLGAVRAGQTLLGRMLALASIASICVANYAMLASYKGEKSWETQWAGPIERRAIQRRGSFEYVDKEDPSDGGGSPGGNARAAAAGSAGSDSAGGATGGGGSTASRAAPGLLSRLGLAAEAANADLVPEARRDCPDCPEMVVVQPGFLHMGAANGDRDALDAERPRRVIKVSRAFAIGRREVTVGEYMAFVRATNRPAPRCETGRSSAAGLTSAIDCVNYRDAVDYIGWLNTTTNRGYRLPTEAEWEWAARGGSSDRFVTGPVLRQPLGANGFGLTGIHGGVAEIVAGCWSDTLREVPGDAARATRKGDCGQRVVRDAGADEAEALRRLSARRSIGLREARHNVGFRVARDL